MKDKKKSIFDLVLNTVSKLPWWSKTQSSRSKHMKPGKDFNQPVSAPPTDYFKEVNDNEFKELVIMLFKQRGYTIPKQAEKPYDDIDLILEMNNETTFVHYSEWKKQQIDVKVIAQLYVAMKEEYANHGILITTGIFTAEALDLSLGKAILLINGHDLSQMIGALQSSDALEENSSDETAEAEQEEMPELDPLCPICSRNMIKRTARKGKNAGNTFWGCSQFPNCRGVISN